MSDEKEITTKDISNYIIVMKRISELEKKVDTEIDEVKMMTKHTHPVFKQEIAELRKKLDKTEDDYENALTEHERYIAEDLLEPQLTELKERCKRIEEGIHWNLTYLQKQISPNTEVLRELITTFIPELSFNERCAIIFEKELLAKLDGEKELCLSHPFREVGSARQTVKQPTPFRCRNLDRVLCPDRECPCEAYEPIETEKKEVKCPKCYCTFEYSKYIIEDSGGENLRLESTPQTSAEMRVMGEGKEASIDSKPPEPIMVNPISFAQDDSKPPEPIMVNPISFAQDDSKPPEPKFTCGDCGKEFQSYHDGDGIQTGRCQKCHWDEFISKLENKPKKDIFYCGICKVIHRRGCKGIEPIEDRLPGGTGTEPREDDDDIRQNKVALFNINTHILVKREKIDFWRKELLNKTTEVLKSMREVLGIEM